MIDKDGEDNLIRATNNSIYLIIYKWITLTDDINILNTGLHK